MGYAGKLELKLKARGLRRKGLSIGKIQEELGVSRSSVSLWVRDIKLTQRQIRRLYLNKKTGRLKGSIVAATNKIRAREELTRRIIKTARGEIGALSKRDRFIAGVALYFAEGDKGGKNVAFSNSDPNAIKFMADWLRVECGVPEEKFRCYLYIHDNLDEVKAKRFWSKLICVPLTQFRKSYIVKNNPNRLRKVKHVHGVLRIAVSDVNLHRRIMGWISKVFEVE